MFAPISADVPMAWTEFISKWRRDVPAVVRGKDPSWFRAINPDSRRIVKIIADAFGVYESCMYHGNGDGSGAARQARCAGAMLLRNNARMNTQNIAVALAWGHVTAVHKALEQADTLFAKDPEFRRKIRKIKAEIEGCADA